MEYRQDIAEKIPCRHKIQDNGSAIGISVSEKLDSIVKAETGQDMGTCL